MVSDQLNHRRLFLGVQFIDLPTTNHHPQPTTNIRNVFRLDTLLLPHLRQADRQHHILLRVLQAGRVRTVIEPQHRPKLPSIQWSQLPMGVLETLDGHEQALPVTSL